MLVIHTYTKTWAPYASVCIRLPSFLRFLSVCVRGFLLNLFSLYLHVKVTHYSRARSQAHIDVLITSHLPDDLESEIVYFYRDRSRSSQSTHHDQTPMPCTSVVALTWLTTFIFQFTSLENNGSGGCSRGATSTIMPNPIDHSPYAYQYAGSSVGQVSSSPLPDSPVPPRTRTYTVLELVCVCVYVCVGLSVSQPPSVWWSRLVLAKGTMMMLFPLIMGTGRRQAVVLPGVIYPAADLHYKNPNDCIRRPWQIIMTIRVKTSSRWVPVSFLFSLLL